MILKTKMKLIKQSLVGLAALLTLNSAPAEGKERPSKILKCEVSSVYQDMLERGYAKTASKMKTDEAKANLRQGYCAFGSERYPTRQDALDVALDHLQKAEADGVDPFIGVIYSSLGRETEISAKNLETMLSPSDSPLSLQQQKVFINQYKEHAKNLYAVAMVVLKRLDSQKRFTSYFDQAKSGWERLR